MRVCINCEVPLKKAISYYKGMEFDAYQCPKCKVKIFTEEQATDVARKMKAARLKREYERKPIHIGRSIGMTFPKEITYAFDLDRPETRLKVSHNMKENKIEIEVI